MISGQIRQSLLTDELQLGQDLNNAVASGDRAHFSLLLNLLCADVTELPQFALADKPEMQKSERDLRAQFELREPVPLRGQVMTSEQARGLGECTQAGLNDTVRLQHLLQPEPLCGLDETGGVDSAVLDNISLKKRLQYFEQLQGIKPEPVEYGKVSMNQVIEGFDYGKEVGLSTFSQVA